MASVYRSWPLMGDGYCFDVLGIYVPAKVRGKDSVAPGQEGQYARNRVQHEKEVTVEGWVRGIGETLQDRRDSFHTTMMALRAVMDYSLDPGDLVLEGPDYDLPIGETWTLTARCVNAVHGEMRNQWTYQEWSFELKAVDPPDWVIAPS